MENKVQCDSIMFKIKELYPKFTKGRKSLADYITVNGKAFVNETINDVLSHTPLKSIASVTHFCRLLGYPSFRAFKIALAQELAGRTFYHSRVDITLDDDADTIKHKVFLGAINALTNNADYETDECLRAHQLLYKARKIIIIGHGASSAICQYAYFRFTELGLDCTYNLDSHLNVALISNAKENDIILCVSQSGETSDVLRQIKQANEKKIRTILISGSKHSSIAELSLLVLSTASEEKNVLTDALNSRISQFCLIDALFAMISITNADLSLENLQKTRSIFKTYKVKSSHKNIRREKE